jgi:ABC-type phosphate transport system auxiliary subunit
LNKLLNTCSSDGFRPNPKRNAAGEPQVSAVGILEENDMKQIATTVLLALLIGCESAAERKAHSPECVKLRTEIAARKARREEVDQITTNQIREMKRKIETLRLEDRVRELEGHAASNQVEIAHWEGRIESDELIMQQQQDLEKEIEGFDEVDIQRKCLVQK